MTSTSAKFLKQMALAMEIPMSPVAGGAMGYLIDDYLKSFPWFTAILAFFGFIHAIVLIVRIYREMPPRPEN
ncbi:MAG TPA: AtpZ/AtpI family protein [Candidatus Binataceae bacterium]|nr:AtpZ/AtpI family protein [Candidatus Binataceae bacterium]